MFFGKAVLACKVVGGKAVEQHLVELFRKSPLGERGFSLSLRGLIPYATGCAEGGKDGRRY